MGSSIRTKIYSLDSNAFDTLDNEYFYPQEYVDDPLMTGKPYKPMEIIDMLDDMVDSS